MKKSAFFLLALLPAAFAGAQTIDSTLGRYADHYAFEKAYLHYDKSAYYAGETVWFKAYVTEEMLPATSKTFYVDWIADNGAVLSHSVSPLVDGATNGQFDIPAGYAGNFIHVRAYSKWMLNFDTAFLYSRDLRVLSKAPAAKTPRPAPVATLQFFPEGGDAVAGMANRIAFKATDQFGRPVAVRGLVVDNKGAFVDSFSAVHDGMGSFFLMPQPGSSYTAKWKDERGNEKTTVLPAAKASGIAMQVTASGTRRTISISGSGDLPAALQTLHLIGTMNQRMAFKTDVTLAAGGGLRRVIPTDNLPSGILTITVFDAGWNAIAERITFINNNDFYFRPEMEVKHWGLSPRKRNLVQLTLPQGVDAASLSVAVTDAGIDADSSQNIISQLLLTSDIRGDVYQPAYYFSAKGETVAQHLDLVMLTNGWRRFKWEDVVKEKLPAITYPRDTAYLTLGGQVMGVTKGQLTGKDNIVLMVREKDSASRMLIMPLSSNGTFGDPGLILFDTIRVYYSLKSKFFKEAEARFMIGRLPAPNYNAFSRSFLTSNPYFDTTGSWRHGTLAGEMVRLQEAAKGRLMETVTIKTTRKSLQQEMDEKYASGMFSGISDGYQFDLVNDHVATAYVNIFSYLQGKVAGLQVNASDNPPSLSWRGGAPALYIDELNSDATMLAMVPVTDIAYIKVFRPPFMGGFGGGNGAIAIYTRKGNDADNVPGRGLTSNTVAGYSPIREFYSPNYDSFNARNEAADLRTTLYWNPLLSTTAANRVVNFTFYNNDSAKAFRVVVEGMTRDGRLTHFEQLME